MRSGSLELKKGCQKEQDLKLDPSNLRYPLKKDHSSTCGWVAGREETLPGVGGNYSGGCCNSYHDEGT